MNRKKKTIFLAITLLCINFSLFAQSISIILNNVSVKDAMTELKGKSGYSFVYAASDLDTRKNISVNANDLKQAIEQILSGQDVTYEIQGKNIIISQKGATKQQFSDQQKEIKGNVKDAMGTEIIGASVIEVGTSNGTITDLDGNFSLNVKDNAKIEISFIGFETQRVNVVPGKTLNIVLKEDTKMLDEVVVTGYGGTQKRSKVTNSISSVKKENLSVGLFSNPAQALSGAVSGLRVIQTSGNPSASPRIVLRGGTNLDGSGSPLIVVDGQLREDMADINPEDIESMDVLKDAGATAIYGARANNGVILISTKRGQEGRTQIGIKTKVGFNFLNSPYDWMNGEDYIWWMRTAYQRSSQIFHLSNGQWAGIQNMSTLTSPMPYGTGNIYWEDADKKIPATSIKDSRASYSPMIYTDDLAFLLKEGWQTMIDPVYGNKIIYKDYATSENITSPAMSQDYNASLSGGNQKSSYYANVGYNKTDGLPKGLEYKRISATLNADYKLKPWLTSSTNISFINSKKNALPDGSTANKTNEDMFFSGLMSQPPTLREENPTANFGINIGNYYRNFTTNKFSLAQNLTFNIIEGLSLKLSAMTMFDEIFNESSNKDIIQSGGNVNKTRSTSAFFQRDLQQTYNAILNYKFNIEAKHSVDAMVGYAFYDFRRKGFSASGSEAPTEDFGDLGLTSTGENKRSIDSWHERQRIMSFFGRLNYDYLSRYLLSFTIRRDGYSILLGDNRWGTFPGVSAGWIMSRESFMEKYQDIISFVKVRASYGINGNVSNISGDYVRNGAYDLQGSYVTSAYNGTVGFILGKLANPLLRWEKSHTFEVGLDLSFLENRINTNFTFYDRKTADKYADIPLPGTAGVNTIRTNNGEIRNRGFEFDLGFKIINTNDWSWDVNVNGGINKNKILKLPFNGLEKNRQNASQIYTGNGNELMWVGGYQEGEEPGALYAFLAEGIYKSESEIPGNLIDKTSGDNGSNGLWLYGPEAWAKLSDAQKANASGSAIALPIQPGDVKWKDVNNDGVIDDYDKVKMGYKTPRITGGLHSSVRYKNLTLYARMDYGLGHKILDSRTPWIMGNMVGLYNTINLTKDSWSPENPNGKYPIYTWADQLGKRNYARESSLFVYNGDYLAFREVALSYKVPAHLTNRVGIESLELSVTGQNLGYWTAAKTVYNPEISDGRSIWAGNDSLDRTGGYPLPRTLILGLNVTF